MSDFQPPVKDMAFLLNAVLDFEDEACDAQIVEAILEEASKLASGVLAPLNWEGDQHGATLKDGVVETAPGFKDAYTQYRDGGWNAVPFDDSFGGQALPWAVAFPVQEMWQGANMAFGLCPLLNQGAVEAIFAHGSDEQKAYYLPKLISGEWTGTMNLTEAQAGSDLGLLRAKAEPVDDGSYKVSGQKIFITYGEHDMADNIVHLVLARLPDAPEDVKGISLFLVPKFLEDGTRNTVQCIGLEHKLGIHASPTCTMEFDEATGYLLGEAHQGLKCMFTMMNNARLSVGLQGVAIAEAAYQHAYAYAQDRVQGKDFQTNERVSIQAHADVRRMLMSMSAQIQAGRALTYSAAIALDKAHKGDENARALVDLLTPIVKAWCTDMACDVTSLGVQIHGGMGFVEETGAAQFYRDARILPIYEGTNGIQGLDLAFRKVLRDDGQVAKAYIKMLKQIIAPIDAHEFDKYLPYLEDATAFLVQAGKAGKLGLVAAGATPYLKAFGIIAGAAFLSLSSVVASDLDDQDFAAQKAKSAQFYLHNILPLSLGYMSATVDGSKYV